VRTAGGSAELSFGPETMRWSNGSDVEQIGTATGATPTVDGSKVRYAGVLPGIDAEFSVGSAQLAKSYLLSSLPAMPAMGADAFLEIGERVRLGKGVSLTDMSGAPVKAGALEMGTGLKLTDSLGPMRLDPPIAFDQVMLLKPEQRKGMKKAPMPERLTLVVEPQADGSLMLWTRVPYAYLASPDRSYPVVIDPTITLQPGVPGKDAMIWGGGNDHTNWGNFWLVSRWGHGEDTDGEIEFDLTSIPALSVINTATLTLHVEANVAQPAVGLHENLAAWTEGNGQAQFVPGAGDVTYFNAPAFNPVATATAAGAGGGGNLVFDVKTSVQTMVDGVLANNGWRINANDNYDLTAGDSNALGFGPVANHPILFVDYSDPPPPPDPGGDLEEALDKLDAIEIKLDSDIPDKLDDLGVKLDELGVKLDAIEIKLDSDIPDKLDQILVKLDALEIKLDDGLGDDLGPKLDAIEIKLDDEVRFTDDAELAVIEAKLDDEARWVDDLELSLIEAKLDDETRYTDDAELAVVEAKLDDETRYTDDAELAVIEAKLDAKDDRIESVEGKLDDETRFTDDSELGQAQAAVIAEIDANEVKIDAIEAKLDSLGEKDDILRVEIEKSMLLHDRISFFYLPSAFGGVLELVREIVVEAIVQNQAAGIDVGNAATSLASGDADYAAGDWKGAYDEYQQAYRMVVTGG